MTDYIRLAEAPQWVMHYPTCSACDVDLEIEDDWYCPSCGTSWSQGAGDGDVGELPETRLGEPLTGPVLTASEARQVAAYREALDVHRRMGDKFPGLFPRPKLTRELIALGAE